MTQSSEKKSSILKTLVFISTDSTDSYYYAFINDKISQPTIGL